MPKVDNSTGHRPIRRARGRRRPARSGVAHAMRFIIANKAFTGQMLAIVEAMKKENVLRASQDGVVAKLRAQAGDTLSADQIILELESAPVPT